MGLQRGLQRCHVSPPRSESKDPRACHGQVIIYAFVPVSGANVNPALTLALCLADRLPKSQDFFLEFQEYSCDLEHMTWS